ncbi:MAG: polysaccharide deacetylase family protein [Phycisphaerae bacterium]|nr:polysaccharide deacetylase family protein [Phycisphaerae bacterium]
MSKGFFPGGRKAALSLSFDDARSSQVSPGLDVLAEYDLPVTFYVSLGGIEDRLDGWRRATAAGHEIGEGGRQTTQIPVLRELGSYLRNRQADLCVAPVVAVADHIRQHR